MLFRSSEERIEHWNSLSKARAIENQTFFIGCNGVGKSKNTKLGGNSLVIDPWGNLLNKQTNTENIFNIEIDLQQVNIVREKLPVLADRIIK